MHTNTDKDKSNKINQDKFEIKNEFEDEYDDISEDEFINNLVDEINKNKEVCFNLK